MNVTAAAVDELFEAKAYEARYQRVYDREVCNELLTSMFTARERVWQKMRRCVSNAPTKVAYLYLYYVRRFLTLGKQLALSTHHFRPRSVQHNPAMSGRQQRVMVQPIVCFRSFYDT